ncbi:unnamed protein product [marine sediment metagenome]|uniref:Uncharacterized protein n=1 Tax=marine sediment metagenome TaxID=412755 RepID=X0UJI2_9ZZZZ
MLELAILKTWDGENYKAGVQLAGSLTTYLDDIAVATNIAPEAMTVGNYVLVAIPGGNPRDACVVASWPQGSSGTASLTFVIDGGGSAITTGQKGHLEIPFACTIQRVTMLADQSGSIVVDIWKDSYANFPPTDADSITASAPPTISSAQKSHDSTLTGWTKSISAGDILAFNVDSCATITLVTISLKVEKS